jgi:hypothetical protein
MGNHCAGIVSSGMIGAGAMFIIAPALPFEDPKSGCTWPLARVAF